MTILSQMQGIVHAYCMKIACFSYSEGKQADSTKGHTMQEYHSRNKEAVLKELGANSITGLTEQEAGRRLRENGPNELTSQKKKGILSRFLEQFKDFMILILLAAAAISYSVSVMEGKPDIADSVIILLIVVLNAVLGVIQESKAERSIEALKQLSAPEAFVLRDGKRNRIASKNLVVGDIVYLEAGAMVPADIRLLESTDLEIDESSLTGESEPVKKNASFSATREMMPGDCKNMAFSMTLVTAGHGYGVVTACGMQTETGKIAGMIQQGDEKETPLQKKLSDVGRYLGIAAVIICVVIFLIGILQGRPAFSMFMTAVSLAVAAIPEGLPAIVTIMLSIGVQRMARKRAIVRKLAAVETLGSASVICSDKTGTLTKNLLTLTEYATVGGGMVPLRTKLPEQNILLESAVLCSNAQMDANGIISGSMMEQAILRAAKECGVDATAVRHRYRRISEIPFDSARKRMNSLHNGADGNRFEIIKGAFDYLLPMCTMYLQDGKLLPLERKVKEQLVKLHAGMAGRALRVLAVIRKERVSTGSAGTDERGYTFLGLLGFLDPPREESMRAVALCKSAGIRPVMVTGDHALTAGAIAKEIGILSDGNVITGNELQKMSDADLKNAVMQCNVFARVSPEHKVRIVNAFRANGEVVAMTGDGINDAPALKNADIGCAMGKTGTDVAKSAADMILTDDNFATIVEAVREGRCIYDNIRKSVHFLLSSNIGEILTILLAVLCKLPTPLAAVQLLWVNLVTDSLPAIALGTEAPEEAVMKRQPVSAKSGIFADGMIARILFEGIMIGILALIAFAIGGQTMTFAVLSLSQLVHAYNMRSTEPVLRIGLLSNIRMNLAFVAGVVLQVTVIMAEPLQDVFHTETMSGIQWIITAGLSLMPLLIVELQKRVSGKE